VPSKSQKSLFKRAFYKNGFTKSLEIFTEDRQHTHTRTLSISLRAIGCGLQEKLPKLTSLESLVVTVCSAKLRSPQKYEKTTK
jgi:hypothetical protein